MRPIPRQQDQRLTELFEAYAPRLLVYASRHAPRTEAEDLVAEAFATAIRRLDDIPAGGEMPWLVGCVRKLAANQRRRQSTRDDHWRAAVRDAWHVDPADSPEQAYATRDAALAALAALSETDREALLLVAWEGLTPDQAARLLGLTPNAFGVRLHRARRRLETTWEGTHAQPVEGLS
ncbi:MAG: sigma-70 family RNA polymerase sigma factor [Nocardioides sp.]